MQNSTGKAAGKSRIPVARPDLRARRRRCRRCPRTCWWRGVSWGVVVSSQRSASRRDRQASSLALPGRRDREVQIEMLVDLADLYFATTISPRPRARMHTPVRKNTHRRAHGHTRAHRPVLLVVLVVDPASDVPGPAGRGGASPQQHHHAPCNSISVPSRTHLHLHSQVG